MRHVERPRRLSYIWNVRYEPERPGEAPSQVTRGIEPVGEACRLTVTHRFSEPCKTFREVNSGWNAILSPLKSLLDTGEPLSNRLLKTVTRDVNQGCGHPHSPVTQLDSTRSGHV